MHARRVPTNAICHTAESKTTQGDLTYDAPVLMKIPKINEHGFNMVSMAVAGFSHRSTRPVSLRINATSFRKPSSPSHCRISVSTPLLTTPTTTPTPTTTNTDNTTITTTGLLAGIF